MSASEDELIGQLDIKMIAELLAEPSYISEIARKMQKLNLPRGYDEGELGDVTVVKSTWGDVNETTALIGVMIGLNLLTNNREDDFEVLRQGYDVKEDADVGESQSIGSMHRSFEEEGITPGRTWKPYSIIHNTSDVKVGESLSKEGYNEIGGDMANAVDKSVTIEEKAEVAKKLSRVGNKVSIYAEEILQDVMERQFREYSNVGMSEYNQPGPDFIVSDEDRRDYGLVIEVSVRWVNPIGDPYISNKLMTALDLEEEGASSQPWDVVILAPRFTKTARSNYEDPEEVGWHDNPEEGMVHLHRVPSRDPEVYRPFAKTQDDIDEESLDGKGNPVIIPDSEELRQNILSTGNVGDDYPIADSEEDEFRRMLDDVFRDFVVVTESQYRNMLREAIEPLLWEFMRPYKIEQFLIDTYWDKELTQSEIGKLVSRSSGTIGDWMREWGVMRRGTGAPELSEEVKEIWRRMYEGESPFPKQFSGYRILAEYNRHPLWSLEDWEDWYQNTSEEERKKVSGMQDSFRRNLDYTILVGARDRLTPSYSFILSTLKSIGVDVRKPDEAPRVPYSAYPSRGALKYMINKDETTVVDVSDGDSDE